MRIHKKPEGTGITVENVEVNMEGMKNALSKVRNVISASISTKVAADIFHMKDNDYLLLVDYYSKWLEVHKPDNLSSKNTIAYVKSTFSRNGVPDIFFTDNGCQSSSQEFKDVATEYGFTHRTPSPTYLLSNGQVERTVQTVKTFLKKASDPYKALLDYRNTEIPDIELSPAQIFFGRRLRTLLPTTAPILNAHNRQDIRKKLKERQHMQKHYYDQHSKPLEPLENGQKVLIHNGEKWVNYATVQRKRHTPRSYIVRTDDGKLYRRNRRHLRPTNAYQQHEPQEHQVGNQVHYRNP